MIDLDSYIPRYIEISYIALTVKKSDVSVNVKGEMKGAYPYKFKYFNTSGYLHKGQGEHLRDIKVGEDGSLTAEEGVDTYYIRAKALQGGRVTIYTPDSQPYKYALITDSDKN